MYDENEVTKNPGLDLTPKQKQLMSDVHRHSLQIDIDWDLHFWAITPAFNLNLHDRFTFEFEWLCIGIYIFKKEE